MQVMLSRFATAFSASNTSEEMLEELEMLALEQMLGESCEVNNSSCSKWRVGHEKHQQAS